MSRSKQNLLSKMSVVLRTQDLSVTDSVSPWKIQRILKIIIMVNGWDHHACVALTTNCSVLYGHSQSSHQICGRRSPCAKSSALWQMCSSVWPSLTQMEEALENKKPDVTFQLHLDQNNGFGQETDEILQRTFRTKCEVNQFYWSHQNDNMSASRNIVDQNDCIIWNLKIIVIIKISTTVA